MTFVELTKLYLQADAETKELCKIVLEADADTQARIDTVLEEWKTSGGSPEELRKRLKKVI